MSNPFETSTDQELLLALKKHEQQAFDQLFRRYYPDLCQRAIRYLGDPYESEEVVQEVFIYLWEKRTQLNITSSPRAYLSTAVKNRSFNRLRGKTHVSLDEHVITKMVAPETNEELDDKALKDLIFKGIDQLPARCKIIFRLSRESGLSYQEIADSLEISIKTVEAQMSIALKRMRDFLGKHWDHLASLALLFSLLS